MVELFVIFYRFVELNPLLSNCWSKIISLITKVRLDIKNPQMKLGFFSRSECNVPQELGDPQTQSVQSCCSDFSQSLKFSVESFYAAQWAEISDLGFWCCYIDEINEHMECSYYTSQKNTKKMYRLFSKSYRKLISV